STASTNQHQHCCSQRTGNASGNWQRACSTYHRASRKIRPLPQTRAPDHRARHQRQALSSIARTHYGGVMPELMQLRMAAREIFEETLREVNASDAVYQAIRVEGSRIAVRNLTFDYGPRKVYSIAM